jgi:hypothetical protein
MNAVHVYVLLPGVPKGQIWSFTTLPRTGEIVVLSGKLYTVAVVSHFPVGENDLADAEIVLAER